MNIDFQDNDLNSFLNKSDFEERVFETDNDFESEDDARLMQYANQASDMDSNQGKFICFILLN